MTGLATGQPHRVVDRQGETGASPGSLLAIRGLTVQFGMPTGVVRAVNEVSLDIRQGETVGVVGESGSGKSVTFLSVMGMVRSPGRIVAGSVELDGRDLASMDREALRRVRGREIAMVFQDPQTSLNPVFPIGRQITDILRAHLPIGEAEAKARALEVLDMVRIPEARRRFGNYPHEFSGGMRQRVMIAMALALRPRFIIADEPTTALDVTMQAQVLELLHELKQEVNVGLVLITHDLGVVARSADRVVVMYGGRIVERGTVQAIFRDPQHPYTLALMRSMPRIDTPRGQRLQSIGGSPPNLARIPPGCAFHPRCAIARGREVCRTAVPALAPVATVRDHLAACHFSEEVRSAAETPPEVAATHALPVAESAPLLEVRDLRTHFPVGGLQLPWRKQVVRAVDGVSFTIRAGETVGLVGESGCGKSTLGRTLIRLIDPTGGSVLFSGQDIAGLRQRDMRRFRTDIQMVFQDPYASLDPRMTVRDILQEPFEAHGRVDTATAGRIAELMDRVGLDPEHADRRPHEFSGGQRQRIGIARALALNPKLIVLDEPVSALDVSVQAQIINLLEDLQAEFGLTYVFIAHDLSVVRHLCDRVLVMYLGRIVEHGPTDALFAEPRHPYSQVLLSSVPVPDPERERTRPHVLVRGSVPSPIDPPRGCHFHARCPRAAMVADGLPPEERATVAGGGHVPRRCVETYPPLETDAAGHGHACHYVAGFGTAGQPA